MYYYLFPFSLGAVIAICAVSITAGPIGQAKGMTQALGRFKAEMERKKALVPPASSFYCR